VGYTEKILIGGIINIVPIVNFIAMGYALEETKRAYEGRELPLPEWDNFSDYFMKGLMAAVAGFVYSIPIMVLACCMWVPLAGPLAASDSKSAAGLGGVAMILVFCVACLLVLYGIAMLLLFPALYTRYALTDQFGVFFQFGPALQLIQSNTGGYVMAVIVFVIASIIAGIIGSIACGIGALFTNFWATLVAAYLFGNFARGTAASMAPSST